MPKTLEGADEMIRLLHETLVTLDSRARQIEDTQSAGSHVRLLKKLREWMSAVIERSGRSFSAPNSQSSTLPDWYGSLRQRPSLGQKASGNGAYGSTDVTTVRKAVRKNQQELRGVLRPSGRSPD
jgi:hypothetical protein